MAFINFGTGIALCIVSTKKKSEMDKIIVKRIHNGFVVTNSEELYYKTVDEVETYIRENIIKNIIFNGVSTLKIQDSIKISFTSPTVEEVKEN